MYSGVIETYTDTDTGGYDMRIFRFEAAEIWGVKPGTYSAYVSRGQAPEPIVHVGSTPLWDLDEVKTAHAKRPGRGYWRAKEKVPA